MVLTVLFRHTAASVAELLVAATSAAAAASWQSMWLPLVGQATKDGSGMPEKHSKKPSPFFLMVLKPPLPAQNGSHPPTAPGPRKSGRRTGRAGYEGRTGKEGLLSGKWMEVQRR